ncbi:MAG: hypothetical protein IPK07_05245 [Deltaproteobacteria bacterium]|nr:hypothetical protein [Deltaproteobacteria bacterium]
MRAASTAVGEVVVTRPVQNTRPLVASTSEVRALTRHPLGPDQSERDRVRDEGLGELHAAPRHPLLHGLLARGHREPLGERPDDDLRPWREGRSRRHGTVNGSEHASWLRTVTDTKDLVTYLGSSGFSGFLYAPDTTATFAGSSDVYGELVGRDVILEGSAMVHYDAAATSFGYIPDGRFEVEAWSAG